MKRTAGLNQLGPPRRVPGMTLSDRAARLRLMRSRLRKEANRRFTAQQAKTKARQGEPPEPMSPEKQKFWKEANARKAFRQICGATGAGTMPSVRKPSLPKFNLPPLIED